MRLVELSLMAQPAVRELFLGVVVGPVDNSTSVVPAVMAEEINPVPAGEGVDSRSEFDVVGDDDTLLRSDLEDEFLMAVTLKVIRQQAGHHPVPFDLYVAQPVGKSDFHGGTGPVRFLLPGDVADIGSENQKQDEQGENHPAFRLNLLFHCSFFFHLLKSPSRHGLRKGFSILWSEGTVSSSL